jgi:hypothetical protein
MIALARDGASSLRLPVGRLGLRTNLERRAAENDRPGPGASGSWPEATIPGPQANTSGPEAIGGLLPLVLQQWGITTTELTAADRVTAFVT